MHGQNHIKFDHYMLKQVTDIFSLVLLLYGIKLRDRNALS